MVKIMRNNMFIPELIRLMTSETDSNQITRYENKMACMIASPALFFATFLNFGYNFLSLESDFGLFDSAIGMKTLIDSAVLLILAVLFEIIHRIGIKTRWASFFVGLLYAVWFLFVLIRLYPMVGYGVWLLGCLQIIIAMGRTNNRMALFLGATVLTGGIWVFFHQDMYYYQTIRFSFFMQGFLIIFIMITTAMIHKINKGRYQTMQEQNRQLLNLMMRIKKNEQSLITLANVDYLTGLPNRRYFIQSLHDIIETAEGQGKIFYIVFIDLDSFKKINDTLGHDKGDIFIQSIAARLKEGTLANDLLGRIGGDEFGLVINRNIDRKEVYREIGKIREGFEEPVVIDGSKVKLSASFGVAEYPKDGTTPAELLRHSDISMYKAKSLGKNRIHFFNKTLMEDMIHQLKMEDRLRKAISNNELHLVYQPQYELKNRKLRGFEALLRWESKEFGSVPPTEFIELAEHKGLIISLGEWVIREAFRDYSRFKMIHDGKLIMSINVSLAQITDSNLIKLIKNCMNEYAALPDEIELEVTESIFAEAIEKTAQVLKELKKLGIRIALDDFGTGYSSISYLKLFPIDTLKIDRSFTRDLINDSDNRNIMLGMIALGHDLNAEVLVEGIEQEFQMEYLKAAECDYGQGFLLGKPMKSELIIPLL